MSLSQSILLAPDTELIQHGHQRFSALRKRICHLRRDLRILGADDQFIGIEDGRIVAAYIMNHDRDEAYHAVKWLIYANDNETVVLHALRVLPEYGGRGYSKQQLGVLLLSSYAIA